jgi:tetratricopeptide (TPR) repeat protein
VTCFARFLCVDLGALCTSAVNLAAKDAQRRGAEHAELAQRVEISSLPVTRRARQRVGRALIISLLFIGTGVPVLAQTPAVTQLQKDEQRLFEAGQAALDQAQYDEALRSYNKILALAAKDRQTLATAHVKIGNVLVAQRRFDRALAEYQQATVLDPDYAVAFNNVGEAQGELRQYNRALEAFNRAVALDPKLSRARYNIGITYGRLGNLKYSEFVFRLLVRDRPEYDLGYDGLAVTLSKSGRPREALAFHQKAITLNPKEPSYYYNLALSYLILGETEKALQQQKLLQSIAPEVANQLASVIVKKQMR